MRNGATTLAVAMSSRRWKTAASTSKDIRQVLTELYEVFDFCAVEEAAHYYENWQS